MKPTRTQLAHAAALIASAATTITGAAAGSPTATHIGALVTTFLAGLTALYAKAPEEGKVAKTKHDKRTPFTMADGVTTADLPSGLSAYLAYVTGRYANYQAIRARFPHARVLGISTTASVLARELDVESGDASPNDVPNYVRRAEKSGIKRVRIYCNLSTAPLVQAAMRREGIPQTAVRWHIAHPNGVRHICGPRTCGKLQFNASATQYDWLPDYDLSYCVGSYLDNA